MKIRLVVTDTSGKNLVFVSDSLTISPLEEAIRLASKGEMYGTHVVQRKSGAYIRTSPDVPKKDEFEQLSISGREIISYAQGTHAVSTPALSEYLRLYIASLQAGQLYIDPIGQPRVLTATVREKFEPHRSIMLSAAERFSIDVNILGGIVIDELSRVHPFEKIIDLLGLKILGRNVSVGIAQVKLETANELIKKKAYNPNPADEKLPFAGTLSNRDREHLYRYVIQPIHNIFFAAAFIRYVTDFWSSYTDLS
ncbi:hypothetical protein HY417_02435, partial [Candidatus Kaiserbacteria bacterium]|nr:hypothetical protein [Candidatus Kaiserbacteria bacterium]